ncbi:HupE/UreJ family protein [Porticoccaceae bacterium]|nr:HupE/UreJ family protein [Porticoccaceae bacterium]
MTEGTGIVSSWQLVCHPSYEQGLVGQVLGVSGLGVNQVSTMVILNLRDGRHYQQILTAETPQFRVPLEPAQGQVMTEYSVLGGEHIWGGIDHLMFVFGLLLLIGVGAGWRLIGTITAFTLGHSISLSLVTLGFLSYSVPLVEFTIALSIFILALDLARGDKGGLFRRYPWWLAGGFGLLHGMGFAGALAEVGLPQGSVPLALLFFNIGIELGQIAFILLLLGAWQLVKRPLSGWQQRLLPVPVYALGGLSAMWCIERGLLLLP